MLKKKKTMDKKGLIKKKDLEGFFSLFFYFNELIKPKLESNGFPKQK